MKLHRGLLAALAVLTTCTSASAATFQIGSFTSAAGNYSYADGLLTGTTAGVFAVDADGLLALSGLMPLSGPAGVLANLTVNATRTGDTFLSGPRAYQGMDGYFEVRRTSDNALILRADFTGGFLGGPLGPGATANLDVATAIGATNIYTSDFFDGATLVDPKSINFTLTPLTPGLQLGANGNFANFTAPDTANFSAALAVPEPVSMSLVGLGLLGASLVARRRRQ